MWNGGEGLEEEDVRISSQGSSQELQETRPAEGGESRGAPGVLGVLVVMKDRRNGEGEEEEDEEEEEEEEDGEDSNEPPQESVRRPGPSPGETQVRLESSSARGQEPEVDPEPDPDPEGDQEEVPHGESFPCRHCERRFSSRQGLERHVHIHAVGGQQAQLFKCCYCSKAFGSQVGRRRHERRHESAPKKKPGSLAGTANPPNPLAQIDVSGPDRGGPPAHYIAIGSQFPAAHPQTSEAQRKEAGPHADRPFVIDENGESKELHPCKYCNKAFGTHTNMRRHQRRIHERHLLPKGVRRKGMLLPEASAQKPQRPGESPNTSPPPVYVPSADTEDEADGDDYAVDISKNISENLSFFIDGKIVSTGTVSACEVIEVDSRSAALFGIDTVIIDPDQIHQALKAEGRAAANKQVPGGHRPAVKRRTSTPPLVPGLKVETETPPSSSSASSSSSNLLVGGLFQQAADFQQAGDSSAFPREKTVYLSPKLKQLLQTQDVQKSAVTLITESHRLASPLSVAPLQGAPGRFKRRTASPPSSPQLSPPCKPDGCKAEAAASYGLKVPKPESQSASPSAFPDKDDADAPSPCGSGAQVPPSSNSGGNSCNQQPLDLSNTPGRRSDGPGRALGDSALDLSLGRKSGAEPDPKAGPAPPAPVKKKKPNTSMLEKVLMNEYVGLSLGADEGPSSLAGLSCFVSRSPNVPSESARSSPPSLTPVTMNPASPCASSVTSPTPPPPVLPTIPSPPGTADSPLSQPSDASAVRPLPVLSPKMSPRAVDDISSPEEAESAEEERSEEAEAAAPPRTPLREPVGASPAGSPEPSAGSPASAEVPRTREDPTDGQTVDDLELAVAVGEPAKAEPADASPPPGSSPSSPSPPASPARSPSPSPSPPPPPPLPADIKIKEEAPPCGEPPDPPAADPPEAEEEDGSYRKTFVCNVCEDPLESMKELSGHIARHATDWPFKCEFCLQLFGDAPALLGHRTALHGVGRIFLCSVCSKEFAFLCNLQQHQKDLHPNETCSHTAVESGKLRPQNYTDPSRAKEEGGAAAPEDADWEPVKKEPDVNGERGEDGAEDPNEELYTTIKIMASEGGKPKGPEVRLGINQHYPSYKPPPFPYHSRSHAGAVASATNFTTHNIPQTFTTAIRCTKCGNSFDNMPELHKHILACANASDKKRYTPRKNPIPLKQIVKCPNGVASPVAAAATAATAAAAAGQSAFRRMGQPKRLNFSQDAAKTKMSALSKKKNQLVQKAISQRNRAASGAKRSSAKAEAEPSNVCPHCSREFTYPASLSKHMTVSCPMKPPAKKPKRAGPEVKREPGDRNMSLRRKPSDADGPPAEAGPRPLGKTRARSSGAAEAERSHARGAKRPASFPAPSSAAKKPKKGPVPPGPPDADSAHRPAARTQRAGREPPPRRPPEARSAPPRREERFSLRNRERAGGPVTRSVQMATPPSAEEPGGPEPADTQEASMK